MDSKRNLGKCYGYFERGAMMNNEHVYTVHYVKPGKKIMCMFSGTDLELAKSINVEEIYNRMVFTGEKIHLEDNDYLVINGHRDNQYFQHDATILSSGDIIKPFKDGKWYDAWLSHEEYINELPNLYPELYK